MEECLLTYFDFVPAVIIILKILFVRIIMKRIFSVIVAAFMLVSLFAVNAFAADSKEIKLPFEMGIPSIEELSVFNNGSLFQFQFVDSEPYQNFWDKEKNHTYIRQLVDAGIERDSHGVSSHPLVWLLIAGDGCCASGHPSPAFF